VVTYLVRVWLPDRPGVLGAVASRIGAVRGDVVGIDILERDGGVAVDELAVTLPDASLLDLMLQEIGEVDRVRVEQVLPARVPMPDPRLDALETAVRLVEARSVRSLLGTLLARSASDFDAEWGAVLDTGTGRSLDRVGPAPDPRWLAAYDAGHRAGTRGGESDPSPADVAWADLDVAGLAIVLGRAERPFRRRERLQLALLARVADRRFADLVEREAMLSHPGTCASGPRPLASDLGARPGAALGRDASPDTPAPVTQASLGPSPDAP
jgi:hypothetical protein